MAGEGDIIFDERAMHREFQSWAGPTGRLISEKAQSLESLARISAGFDTGELIASIGTDYGYNERTQDLEAKVGANPHLDLGIGYAYFHHEGTQPHTIRPRRANVLRFVKSGMVVFAAKVWHPGTTPVKYLTRWLRDVI